MDVMRIVSAELRALRIPLREPLATAGGEMRVHELGLLRITGPDGLVGLGEALGLPRPSASERLGDTLRGLDAADARAVAGLLERLDAEPWAGRAVRSAVSSAIGDLLARAQRRSLAALLGGEARDSVGVNGLIGRLSATQAADRSAALVGEGYRCIKVKGGAEPIAAVLERVDAVRAAAGPGVALRLDLNGSLDATDAEAMLTRLGAYDLEYVEQPLPPTASTADLARLRRRMHVPIAADESVSDLATARALLDADAVDAMVVKPARVGGVAEAAAIVELAAQAGVPVTVSTLLESGIGLAGALQVASLVPGDVAHGLSTGALQATDLLAVPLTVAEGRMAVPDGPGLGVDLDGPAIERWGVV